MWFTNKAKKLGMAALVAASLLVTAGIAISQSISLPQVTTVNPTADMVQIVPNGQPTAQSVFATPAQLATTSNTTVNSTALSGYSYTFANSQSDMLFDFGGSTVTYAYITFAPNPSNGARECFFSNGTITTLYLAANTGQTLRNATTAVTANTRYCWDYSTANLTWTRAN